MAIIQKAMTIFGRNATNTAMTVYYHDNFNKFQQVFCLFFRTINLKRSFHFSFIPKKYDGKLVCPLFKRETSSEYTFLYQ